MDLCYLNKSLVIKNVRLLTETKAFGKNIGGIRILFGLKRFTDFLKIYAAYVLFYISLPNTAITNT